MCTSEGVSWATLAVGTTVNILCFWALSRFVREWRLPVIVGLFWQYGLLMQLPEAMVWRTGGGDAWERLAFGLNVTQPHVGVALAIVAWHYTDEKMSTWSYKRRGIFLIGLFVLVLYSFVVFDASPRCELDMIKPPCPHLSLSWWEGGGCLSATRDVLLYMAAAVFGLAILPWPWSVVQLAIWGSTLAISQWYYECSNGSMWCWMVVFANVVVASVARALEGRHPPTGRPKTVRYRVFV